MKKKSIRKLEELKVAILPKSLQKQVKGGDDGDGGIIILDSVDT